MNKKEEIIQMLKDNPIKEINIGGKNLLEGTYFDGNGIPKMIGITKAEYLEYKKSKDNWNKLKEFLEDWKENEKYCYLASSPIDRCRKDIYGEILDKMQELEQGSDSNE